MACWVATSPPRAPAGGGVIRIHPTGHQVLFPLLIALSTLLTDPGWTRLAASCLSPPDPNDPELMSEEVRQRMKAGESLPVGSMKIPMIDLPLGATEDRVCGTIDIEKALTEGERAGCGCEGDVLE